MVLNGNDLIQIGSIKTSSHEYSKKILNELNNLDATISELKPLKNFESLQTVVSELEFMLFNNRKNSGYGYISTSPNFDEKTELFWTALTYKCFSAGNSFQPLIIKIDDFYDYAPQNNSLILKTRILLDEIGRDKYALILSGFTSSKIFKENLLKQLPTYRKLALKNQGKQFNPDEDPDELTEFAQDFRQFNTKLSELIAKHKDIRLVRSELSKFLSTEDAELLIISNLLMANTDWQALWFDINIPTVIVAPYEFNHAMARMDQYYDYSPFDYVIRARFKYDPVFWFEENEPKIVDEFKTRNVYEGGDQEAYKERIEVALSKVTNFG